MWTLGCALVGLATRAADVLFARIVSYSGKIAAVMAPVVHRIARLAERPQRRCMDGIDGRKDQCEGRRTRVRPRPSRTALPAGTL